MPYTAPQQVARALNKAHGAAVGPAYYQVEKADAIVRTRQPSAVITPATKTVTDKGDAPDLNAQSKRSHQEDQKDGKSSKKSWSSDDDSEEDNYGYDRVGYGSKYDSSDDDSVMEYKRARWKKRAREGSRGKQKAEAKISMRTQLEQPSTKSPNKRVRGAIIAPDRPAGINWHNRVAIAKAREERERPRRLFGYQVNYAITEPRIVCGAAFAAEEEARKRELERQEAKPGLLNVQAIKAQSERARDNFLAPQLAHPWANGELGKAHLALMDSIHAYARRRDLSNRAAPIYRQTGPQSTQALLAREIKAAVEKRRNSWLVPQLQVAWGTNEAGPDLAKQPGRQVVVVEKKGQKSVIDFTQPAQAMNDLGPGSYDVGHVVDRLREVKSGGKALLEFSKISTSHQFGTAGIVPGDFEDIEGDVLQLMADPNVVKKRIKSFTFSKVDTTQATGPKIAEGDILDLEPERWEKAVIDRRGARALEFSKMGPGHGKEEACRPFGDIDDIDMGEGDILQLEVRTHLQERRVIAPPWPKIERWADPVPRGDGDGDNEGLVANRGPMTPPNDDLQRKRPVIAVNMSKQRGRWDRENEEQALSRLPGAQMDERDAVAYAIKNESDAAQAIEKAQGGAILSYRSRGDACYVDMARQQESIPSPKAVTREDVALAVQEAVEKDRALEKAERLHLSNKSYRVRGMDLSKVKGRPVDMRQQDTEEGIETANGDVLKLSPTTATKMSSKSKRVKGTLEWSKQQTRATDEAVEEEAYEPVAFDPGSKKSARPAKGISFDMQVSRKCLGVDIEDGMVMPPEGHRLLLSPKYDMAKPKVKGASWANTSVASKDMRMKSRPSKRKKEKDSTEDVRMALGGLSLDFPE